jgi:hypothetical protein
MARAKTHAKFSNRKISETFLDFAEPLLAPLGAEATEHEMEEALKIAFTVWNAVVFDAVNRNSRWVDQLRDLAGQDPSVRAVVEQLVARKQSLFGKDHRLIGEYRLHRHHGELRLRAEARQPNPGGSKPPGNGRRQANAKPPNSPDRAAPGARRTGPQW